MSDAIKEPDEHDLVYVNANGFPDYVDFPTQATTDEIAYFVTPTDRYCLQQVSGIWEVYDLKTLKEFMGGWTIGIPKFVHESFDAALTWAMMNL